MEQNKFDVSQAKVHRTLGGTLAEALCMVLVVANWALLVPTVRSEDGITGKLVGNVVGTLAALMLLVCAYFPKQINKTYKLTTLRQMWLAVWFCRVMGVEMCALFLLLTVFSHLGIIEPDWLFGGVVGVTTFAFGILFERAKAPGTED